MIETHTTQVRMDESSRCRERSWLSMADEKRFGVRNPIDVDENSGEFGNHELSVSNAAFDRRIHIGQKVYLPGDQFVGLITKKFLDASGHVSQLAIRTARIFGRHKIVPMKAVRTATNTNVQLSITHNQFKELPKYQADSTIAEGVDRALWNDVVLRSSDYNQIDVRVQDGIVILNGHVNTSMSQWRAETTVKNIPGILGVKSHLISDDKLIYEVASALGQIEQQEDCKFFSKVENGLAVLFGEVSSLSIRDQAEQCVAAIPWVRGVINEIRVTGIAVDPGDQRFIQPLIGKELVFKDAHSVTIQKVVINPHNRRVVAVVVFGMFPDPIQMKQDSDYRGESSRMRLVTLPIDLIFQLTGSAGFIGNDSDKTNEYEDYDSSRYISPEKNWLPPYPYCADQVLFLS
jgi:osmotically-inducible protein OsmY